MSALAKPGWTKGTPFPHLTDEALHVWRIALALDETLANACWATLAEDEKARATRFFFAADRQRFVIARGALRHILARYLGVEPAALRFTYNPYGKPALLAVTPTTPLTFNLSHSGELALLAVTRYAAVGIDIEQQKSGLAFLEMAAQQFAPLEYETLQSLPAALQAAAFYRGWVRKEAFIKAVGLGLSLGLARFAVTLAPAEAPLFLQLPAEYAAGHWHLHDIFPSLNYAAAVAFNNAQPLALQTYHWRYAEN